METICVETVPGGELELLRDVILALFRALKKTIKIIFGFFKRSFLSLLVNSRRLFECAVRLLVVLFHSFGID